ncbi:hypothetical protein HO173_007071 [Letharia columbiana]|uniref:Uncharacterized protein n=1 Tax=Letharia columbiana TaxID=112416 RepID=A0A8H6L469_9LECA|nr:uncharacterized protein HO173_007071 [Letharia columbiana]KAF6234851.1 hypothetical protein HO173_007071 [Letharia columbiana]
MLSVLSIAIAASARPSPQTSTSSCTANQQEGCCSSIAAKRHRLRLHLFNFEPPRPNVHLWSDVGVL